MDNKAAMQQQVSSRRHAVKKPVSFLLFLLVALILPLEFFYDLKKEPLLLQIVTALDIVLLFTFFVILGLRAYRKRAFILDVIIDNKADVAYLLVIVFFLFAVRLAAGLVIVRLLIAFLMRSLETRRGARLLASLNLRPSQTLALSFVGLIMTGTLLLTFPAATTDGKGASFINALFSMTSASCVAGLAVYDLGLDFTRFGQAVILFGMQAGGLGIMVLSAAFAVLVGGSIPSRRQAGLGEVLDISTPEGLRSLIRSVTAATVITEFVGALVLFILWQDYIPKASDRLWWAIFHAVSAFCNCGLSLSSNNLEPFVNQPLVCIIFMILITIGGIGFFVISDLTNPDVWRVKKIGAIWNRLQIQTKIVLTATVILDCAGMLLFLFFEYDGALHGLSVDSKIIASLFHSISLRSAGFNVVSLTHIAGPTVIFSIAFMFIGASPGSTGGGIKTTTAAVSVMALRAMLRGREEVELLGRRLPSSIVSRSLSVFLVALMVVFVFLTLLLATQPIRFENLFFETVSAFGTVGLSMGTTHLLDNTGKLLIVCVMYVGRIGPLTLALAVGERRMAQGYRLPKGRIAIG
jgi:trk system potassium uptake protein